MSKCLALAAVAVLPATSAGAAEINCQSPVDVIGTPEKMRAHDFSTIVWLKNAPLSDLSVGYGPGTDPRAEITIVDGHYHVAHPEGETVRVEIDPAEQGAAMLVRADPGAWTGGGSLEDIFDLASLNLAISDLAKAKGCSGDVTFPFRIRGHAVALQWSVDGEPEKALGMLEDVDVILVGVYSNHDKANTFMSPGYSLHAHVLVPSTGHAGHVVDVELDDGATIELPQAD